MTVQITAAGPEVLLLGLHFCFFIPSKSIWCLGDMHTRRSITLTRVTFNPHLTLQDPYYGLFFFFFDLID